MSIVDNVVALTVPDAPNGSGALSIASTNAIQLTSVRPSQTLFGQFVVGTLQVATAGYVSNVRLQGRTSGTATWYDLPFGLLNGVLSTGNIVNFRVPMVDATQGTVRIAATAFLPVIANGNSDAFITIPALSTGGARLVGISLTATTAMSAGGGTLLLTVGAGASYATNLLSTTNFNLASLVTGTTTALTLATDNSTLLDSTAGLAIRFRCASNNVGATGNVNVQTVWELMTPGGNNRVLQGTPDGAYAESGTGVPSEVRVQYTRTTTRGVTGSTCQLWVVDSATAV